MTCDLSAHTAQNKDCVYSHNKFFRILTDDFPEKKYVPRQKNEDRTAVHYGQRKLLLSEVEFITNVCNELISLHPKQLFKKIVLIYAGAAPGNHIPLLSRMFPFVKFHLVDPAKFVVQSCENIIIKQEMFTDEMALDLRQEYSDYIRLFISDIRRAGPGMSDLSEDAIEDEVLDDMRSQENWYHSIGAFRSLLKFRLPYVENRKAKQTSINYLSGDVYFQIWPPGSSSETRLYVKERAVAREYDCLKYENQMYHFNMIERVQCYHHDVDAPGLDHCYDCRAEVEVLDNYVKSFDKIFSFCKSSLEKDNMMQADVVTHVNIINKHLEADKKMIKLTWQGKEYSVGFLDIKYGLRIEQVCTPLKECRQQWVDRKKFWPNRPQFIYKSRSDDAIFAEANEKLKKLKNRLDFKTKITGDLNHDSLVKKIKK